MLRSLHEIRARFPALASGTAFLENAGGSQVPDSVIEAVQRYFVDSYVQVGASYPQSVRATEVVEQAHEGIERYAGAGPGTAVLGASTTALVAMLAQCFARALPPGSAIVVAENGHEANIGPWARLAEQGFEVRWWRVDPSAGDASWATLDAVLDDRVKVIAPCHVSNLLGGILDLAPLVERARRIGARTVVDGVAYAPHLPLTFDAWGVDFYVYSTYKVFGPHLAAMLGRPDAWAELEGPNHFFMPRDYFPGKFEPGSVSHEGCAALLGSLAYLDWLGGLGQTFAHEQALTERLLVGLDARGAQVIGPRTNRVGTVSWLEPSRRPREVVAHTDRAGVAIRWGHMYSYRLLQALGLDPEEGVVRASLVHTNSEAEVDRLLDALP